jgi:hypothetical protein
VADVSGFLLFEDSREESLMLGIGQVVDVIVTKVSSNGRVCSVSMDHDKYTTSFVSHLHVYHHESYVLMLNTSFPKFLLSTPFYQGHLYRV